MVINNRLSDGREIRAAAGLDHTTKTVAVTLPYSPVFAYRFFTARKKGPFSVKTSRNGITFRAFFRLVLRSGKHLRFTPSPFFVPCHVERKTAWNGPPSQKQFFITGF